MTESTNPTHRGSVVVAAPPERVYDIVSDVTRTGEWSPVCTACWWDDPAEAGRVGAWFTGRNELPHRTWETRSRVVAAERGREFAWVVGDGYVRWGFTLAPDAGGTSLTESWEFLPAGIAMFHDTYGERAAAEIQERTEQAHTGIARTLAAIRQIAEDTPTGPLSDSDLPSPVEERYFEDYLPGAVYEFGHVHVTEQEILAFAETYDPQAIHTDPGWAATGPFEGLIASGIHTMALCMRLYVDHYVSRVASLASPGLDELRWPRPVRPGDRLSIRVRVVSARPSRSKPDRGLVHTAVEARNQDGDAVLTFTAMNLMARRPAG